jgi:hypothetical protein
MPAKGRFQQVYDDDVKCGKVPLRDGHGAWLERLVSVAKRPLTSKILDRQQSANGVVFFGKDGVFMEATPLKINLLALSAKIMRQSMPDYPTLLVSN